MGDRKLLWILLGLTLTFLVISAKHTGRQQQKAEEDFAEEEFEEDDDDDDDEECDPSCEKKCHRLKCPLGFVRDSCGCCECASSEEGMKPKIVSGPEYVKNVTGGTAALSCEVTGYPIPFISWLKTNVNNNTFDLPGDDKSIMTLTQGGPEKHEITAWIQIIGLRKDHEGDYSCVAFNKHGTARASNRLKVQKKRGKRRNKNKRK